MMNKADVVPDLLELAVSWKKKIVNMQCIINFAYDCYKRFGLYKSDSFVEVWVGSSEFIRASQTNVRREDLPCMDGGSCL